MDNSVGVKNKKTLNKKNQPKSITMADNWKQKEIKRVLTLRDEMNENNIDQKLIKNFLDEQYEKINTEYTNRIKKYYDKIDKVQNKQLNKDLKAKREKAIEILLKNKDF